MLGVGLPVQWAYKSDEAFTINRKVLLTIRFRIDRIKHRSMAALIGVGGLELGQYRAKCRILQCTNVEQILHKHRRIVVNITDFDIDITLVHVLPVPKAVIGYQYPQSNESLCWPLEIHRPD